MITMRMTRKKDLHITNFKSQLLDTRANHRHRSLETRIDQDMPLLRCDEIRRQSPRTHIIKIVRDPMRRKWLMPVTLPLSSKTTPPNPQQHHRTRKIHGYSLSPQLPTESSDCAKCRFRVR